MTSWLSKKCSTACTLGLGQPQLQWESAPQQRKKEIKLGNGVSLMGVQKSLRASYDGAKPSLPLTLREGVARPDLTR